MAAEPCSWCGVEVEPDGGFRATEPEGERRAVFCRLEHVVPWAMQGPAWEAGELSESAGVALEAAQCAAEAGQGPHVHAGQRARGAKERR